jgi:hypothetical protein
VVDILLAVVFGAAFSLGAALIGKVI